MLLYGIHTAFHVFLLQGALEAFLFSTRVSTKALDRSREGMIQSQRVLSIFTVDLESRVSMLEPREPNIP